MTYRITFTDPLDSFVGDLPIKAATDKQAIIQARKLAIKRPFELRKDNRLVFRSELQLLCEGKDRPE